MWRMGDVNTWYTNWENFHSTYVVTEANAANNSFPTGTMISRRQAREGGRLENSEQSLRR